MTDYRIVPATAEHLGEIAANMREADRNEIFASHALTPQEAMRIALERGEECWVGLVDGKPICAFGVVALSLLTGTGVPWMLGTPEIDHHALPFLRRSRRVVAEWNKRFEVLENHVDARNTKSIQWLRWLGFKIRDVVPFGPFNLPFHPFDTRS